ncbi:MAG: putative phosphoribosyl transferase [Rariglobus sp.]|jgi:putative phosphoribosyl transferase|nr:putative phosphoribosyl transferase [Rariglobus sp.]
MTKNRPYRDRRFAGRVLAKETSLVRPGENTLVLALPRGGLPVAEEIAHALDAPLDVFLVRRLGLPDHPELAMGAIASGGIRVLNEDLIESARVTSAELAAVVKHETIELARRETLYRHGRPSPDVRGRPVVIVDDGLATGFTMRAAVAALRRAGCGHLTVAAPVGARSTCAELDAEVDTLVCPLQPQPFHAVGLWYDKFPAVEDDEVFKILARHMDRSAA